MAKFCEYRDLFKWNKNVMEDDWNDGQAYMLKLAMKNGPAEFTTTAKVAEEKSGASKCALEQKLKWVEKDTIGGFETEAKIKNSGEIVADSKLDVLKQYEGFENVRLLYKQTFNKNQTPMQLGVSYLSDKVKYDVYVDATGSNSATHNFTWKCSDSMIFGVTESWKSITDPMQNVKWGVGLTGHFDKSLHWGIGLKGNTPTLENTVLNDATLYFHKDSGAKTVAAEMAYNMPKKAFNCKVGLVVKQSDHTWKFRLHDSGLARAALQWQLHKVCKATVDTTVDVKQALGGSVTSLPLGFTFDVKY